MPQCAINNCNSEVGPKSAHHSYPFPKPSKSPERFAVWRRHARPGRAINKGSRVCATHFTLEDFDQSDMLKIRISPDLFGNIVPKLRGGVVPSLELGEDYEYWGGEATKKRKTGDFQEADWGPSTSWMIRDNEVKVEADDEGFEKMPQRNSVGIQCEFGGEVYRANGVGSETVDK